MGNGSRAILAGLLGFAAAFLVACGGGNGLLSSDQADNLNGQLSSISAAVQAGQCGPANDAARSFSNQVANLPPAISTTLVQNLGQAAATVSALAAKDCQNGGASTSTSSSTQATNPTTTTTTTTTTTNPTTTNPTSSSSSSTTTTETNPTSTSSSSTTPTGGVGVGGTGTAGNQNGQ